jgi:hypothetical protein
MPLEVAEGLGDPGATLQILPLTDEEEDAASSQKRLDASKKGAKQAEQAVAKELFGDRYISP